MKTLLKTCCTWPAHRSGFSDTWWSRLITRLKETIRRITWLRDAFGKQVCHVYPQYSHQIGQYTICTPHWKIMPRLGSFFQNIKLKRKNCTKTPSKYLVLAHILDTCIFYLLKVVMLKINSRKWRVERVASKQPALTYTWTPVLWKLSCCISN